MSDRKIWCGVCEANCGLIATVEGERITKIRPDESSPHSEGFACPKGILFPKVLEDPDRVTTPLRRGDDGEFHPVSWDSALGEIGRRLRKIRDEHGTESIGVTLGNPVGWNYGAFFLTFGMAAALKTKHFYSSASVDINNYWVVGELLYGHNLVNPIPDFERTDFALIIGANPIVSHGSMVTAGNVRAKLQGITGRGGRVVVVDPRRSETAALFEHQPIMPDSDPWLVAAMLKILFEDGLVDPGVATTASGAEFVREITAAIDLDRAAAETGIEPEAIRELTHQLAAADGGFVYGRCGASLGQFSTLTKYLIDCLNVLTGNLDRPGGMIFPEPYLDAESFTKLFKLNGYDRWRTRVDGLPEVLGTSPLASLPREIETPGKGQLKALVLVSNNPATTSPDSKAVRRALGKLDLLVSLDPYINESNENADFILPPTLLLEREGFPLFGQLHYSTPNAHWTDALVPAPGECRDDGWIIDQICKQIGIVPSPAPGAQLLGRLGIRIPPRVAVDAFMRIGRHGDLFGLRRKGISRKKLVNNDGAIKLMDAPPTGVLRERLHTKDKLVHLRHTLMGTEVSRLIERPAPERAEEFPLKLFTIRELRSQNSWLHNVPKLMSGGRGCRLRIHPDDAAERGIADGEQVTVSSPVGAIEAEAAITDEVVRGAVGMPAHWGHRGGWRTAVEAGGGNYNDLVTGAAETLDVVSGNAWLNGIDVEVAVASTDRSGELSESALV